MDIQVIIFDLGGVVFKNGTRKMREFLKTTYSVKDELLKVIFYGEEAGLLRAGKSAPFDFWSFVDFIAIKEKWGIGKSEIRDIWYNFFTPTEGMFELLWALHKNYEIGIISGNFQERILFLEDKYHFKKYFNWEVYSFNVGANKPDIKIYKEAFNKTKASPQNCLYIDDKDIFIEPAKILGMKTILFENCTKLLEDLRQLEIID